ncbi:hypothetical protein O9992_29485 [Vibrio lentus]|nr:hypothetical protein [Vibrio lentus]
MITLIIECWSRVSTAGGPQWWFKTFNVSRALPILTSATFNPPHQAVGQGVSVGLKFDKALQAASAGIRWYSYLADEKCGCQRMVGGYYWFRRLI